MAVLSARPRVAVKNVIVATDFSSASDLAITYAISIARYYGSKLLLVHALESLGHAPHAGTLWGHETELKAKENLDREVEKCREFECSQWLLKGTGQEVVERMLSLDQVDLIVIGIRAGRGFRKVAFGSGAEYFFRNVQCPVMAVGPLVGRSLPMWAPERILLATDLQSDESMATRCAVFLAREHDAELALLHVAPPAPPPYPHDQEHLTRPYFESRLRELLSYKPGLDYPAEFWVEFGRDAVAEIVRMARERAIDLLVLSIHRQEPWGFHFVHEAYRIVAEAPCPVLITQRRD
jgi:nucleotide-binding universal stress UspA family protein